ncbi:MAG: hypothetical protein ACOCWZ_08995 [Spirochaetota bacterium]
METIIKIGLILVLIILAYGFLNQVSVSQAANDLFIYTERAIEEVING